MVRTSFKIGQGTIAELALVPVGSDIEPVRTTITLAAAATKDTTAPATITVPALASGVVIAAGNYLSFVAPTTGKSVLVQVTADAVASDTTLTVDSIPEDIVSGSVAVFPPKLAGRTAANLGRQGNRVTSVTFEDDGYESGLTTSIAQTLEFPGNWIPTDAGFATAEYAFSNLREIYLWLTLPKISSAYTKGRIYKGFASISNLPLETPANGIITGNISAAFNGKPGYVPDAAA